MKIFIFLIMIFQMNSQLLNASQVNEACCEDLEISEKFQKLSLPQYTMLTEDMFKNILENNSIELHFFWSSGFPLNAFENQYNPDKTIDIGGSKWSHKFPLFLEEFLIKSPMNIFVKFICDEITLESNKESLNNMVTHFSERFKIILLDDAVQKMKQEINKLDLMHTLNLTHTTDNIIDRFMNEAEYGNPAIASDFYRLLGMPFLEQGIDNWNCHKTIIYSDIDLFVYSLAKFEPYLKLRDNDYATDCPSYINALITSESESVFKFGKTRNDFIKLFFSNIEDLKSYTEHVLRRINHDQYKNNLRQIADNLKLNFRSLGRHLSCNTYSGIIDLLGPGFVSCLSNSRVYESFKKFKNIDYPHICTLAWQESFLYRNVRIFYLSHIDLTDCDEYDKFESENRKPFKYMLAFALKTKRLGKNHPINRSLKLYLESNNPYNSQSYKSLLEQFSIQKDQNLILEELKKKIKRHKDPKDRYYGKYLSFYCIIEEAFEKLGIEFPLLPEGLILNN